MKCHTGQVNRKEKTHIKLQNVNQACQAFRLNPVEVKCIQSYEMRY